MPKSKFAKLIGPRITRQEIAAGRLQFLFPTLCLGFAGLLIIASIFLPYWQMEVQPSEASQTARVSVYLNHLEGPVTQIDRLSEEIGIRPLTEAAELERSLSVAVVVVIALLVIAAVYIHNQYAALLSLPAVVFPVVFLLDLYYWLRQLGTEIPSASNGLIVPRLSGTAQVGSHTIVTSLGSGFLLATVASILIVLGLLLHRRAYRPLVQAINS